MAFFRSAKKDPAKADPPQPAEPAGADKTGQMEELAARLHALEQLLVQRLDQLQHQQSELAEMLRQLQNSTQAGLQQLDDRLRTAQPAQPAPQVAPAAATTSSRWQRAVLGADLAEHPALDFQRQQLFNGVLEGDPAACWLAGQLLLFQSAPAEKMPQLLKDIGEAYYRWQPKVRAASNTLENALLHWLQKTCEAAGIPNTIELVNPGQRFDSARHSAAMRGVEITEVHGWVVLRDNGKVYTKATVAVK